MAIVRRKSCQQVWSTLALCGAVFGLIEACSPKTTGVVPVPPGPPGTEPNVSPVCAEQDRVQGILVELARESLAVYGRLDPFVFARDPQGPLRENEAARPRDSAGLEKFRAALSEVQGDPTARRGLDANLRRAVQACGETNCPQQPYSIDVTKDVSAAPATIIYRWDVKDTELPTDAQWRSFAALYTLQDPAAGECQALMAFNVTSRSSGTMAKKGRCASPTPTNATEGAPCTPPNGCQWHNASLPGGATCWMCY